MTNIKVCVKCGGSCIKNGLAVRKQRWKCSKCGKGFYTEVEKEAIVNPFKVLMGGKYRKCDVCGVETLNGMMCDGCELIEEWNRDSSDDELKGEDVVRKLDTGSSFEGLNIEEMFKVTVERAETEDISPLDETEGRKLDRDRTLLDDRKRDHAKIKAFNDMVDNIKASELSEFNGLEEDASPLGVNSFAMPTNYSESDKGELGKSFSFKAKRAERAELQLTLFD